MANQKIRQRTQVSKSTTYADTVAPSVTAYETTPANLEDDLNAIRSQLANILNGQTGRWYGSVTRSLATLHTNLATAEASIVSNGAAITALQVVDGLHGGRLTALEATDVTHASRLTALEALAFAGLVLKTISGTLAASEIRTAWNGTDLTATLPTAPANGTYLEIRNRNATPLMVAVGGADTLNDTDPLPQDMVGKYVYLTSATTWYALHSQLSKDFCGDGSDGNFTSVANTTQTVARFYNNFTNSHTYTPDGYPLFVRGKLTNTGTIEADGNAAAGATAGAASGANRTLWSTGAGQPGGAGGTVGAAGSAGTGTAGSGWGGNGGIGGTGNGGANAAGAAGANSVTAATGPQYRSLRNINLHRIVNGVIANVLAGAGGGGGGGGSVGSGGGGGGGAEMLAIYAHHIDNRTGTIAARGGAGGTAPGTNAGGGGGGGGGVVQVQCNIYQGNNPVVTGGAPGAPTGTGTAGIIGASGVYSVVAGRLALAA